MPINKHVISKEAYVDLDEIFEYTFEKFGLNQAIKYLNEIDDAFTKIVDTPQIGRARSELSRGLYSLPVGEHLVFYEIVGDCIRIVRVLYAGKDLPRNF